MRCVGPCSRSLRRIHEATSFNLHSGITPRSFVPSHSCTRIVKKKKKNDFSTKCHKSLRNSGTAAFLPLASTSSPQTIVFSRIVSSGNFSQSRMLSVRQRIGQKNAERFTFKTLVAGQLPPPPKSAISAAMMSQHVLSFADSLIC